MMKALSIMVVIMLAVALGSCGKSEEQPSQAATPAHEGEMKDTTAEELQQIPQQVAEQVGEMAEEAVESAKAAVQETVEEVTDAINEAIPQEAKDMTGTAIEEGKEDTDPKASMKQMMDEKMKDMKAPF